MSGNQIHDKHTISLVIGPCAVVVIGEMIAPAGSPVVTPTSFMRDIFTPRGGKA